MNVGFDVRPGYGEDSDDICLWTFGEGCSLQEKVGNDVRSGDENGLASGARFKVRCGQIRII